MKLELQSVLDFGISKTANVLNQGFSDYLVPIQLDLPGFFNMLRTSHIDVALSKVVFRNGNAVGVALIARRGWSSRLAGMALIPEARGQKIGQGTMEELLAEAKLRGDRGMELEVIEQNEPAVRLYEKVGFSKIRRLLGFILDLPKGEKGELVEIDIRQLADLVNFYGYSKLPWQVSGESLASMGPPIRAYQMGAAYVVMTDPNAEKIVFRSVLTLPDSRREGNAAQLLQALFFDFPEKTWNVPAIFPEEMGGFFEKLGFKRQELNQFQMERVFA